MAESVDEVCKVMKPGTQEFIMLEKVDQNQPATVRTSFRYCQGVAIESEEQVIAKILEKAATSPPDKI